MNSKYFGLAQMANGLACSLKEKCACMPVDWCCIGFNSVTTDAVIDGSYDLWLQNEQTPCLNKYEQKPLVGDIDFNDLNKRSENDRGDQYFTLNCSSSRGNIDDDDDDDTTTDDKPFLNSYFSSSGISTPSSSKLRANRMRLGVRRGLRGVSRKLRKERVKKKCQVPHEIKLLESASEYPSQVLSRSHFLYPVKEESPRSSADEDESIGSLATSRLV